MKKPVKLLPLVLMLAFTISSCEKDETRPIQESENVVVESESFDNLKLKPQDKAPTFWADLSFYFVDTKDNNGKQVWGCVYFRGNCFPEVVITAEMSNVARGILNLAKNEEDTEIISYMNNHYSALKGYLPTELLDDAIDGNFILRYKGVNPEGNEFLLFKNPETLENTYVKPFKF